MMSYLALTLLMGKLRFTGVDTEKINMKKDFLVKYRWDGG